MHYGGVEGWLVGFFRNTTRALTAGCSRPPDIATRHAQLAPAANVSGE